jgi:hypothetical protein
VGRAHEESGQSKGAGAALKEAAAIVENLRAAASADTAALQAVLKQGHPVYQEMVRHLLSVGKVEQVLSGPKRPRRAC